MNKDMATSASAKECGDCHKEFDEETRSPRILHCFHTLCSSCIDHLIKSKNKRCPFCRKQFKANNVHDVTVNQAALELLKYFNSRDSESDCSEKSKNSIQEKSRDDFLEELKESSSCLLARFQETKTQIEDIEKQIDDIQTTVSQENSRIENEVLPKLHDMISQNKNTEEELDKTNRKLNIQLQEIEEKNKQLETMKVELNTYADHTFKETLMVVEEAGKTINDIGKWFENVQELVCKDGGAVKTTGKEISGTKEKLDMVLEVLNPQEEGEEESDPTLRGLVALTLQEDTCGHIPGDTPTARSNGIKRLVNQGRVFAVRKFGGRRSSRISINDYNSLCLHRLDQESLPINIDVDHDDATTDDADQHIEGFIIV